MLICQLTKLSDTHINMSINRDVRHSC